MTHLLLSAEFLLGAGYIVAFAGATAVCLWAAWRARSAPDMDTRRGLLAFFLASAAWAGCYVGFLLVDSSVLKGLFYKTSLIVGFGAVLAWLWFCSAYTGRTLHRRAVVQRLAAGLFAIVTALKLTNPLHGLYYSLLPSGGPAGLVVQHDILYWVVMGLAYTLSGAGYLMLFERYVETNRDARPLAVVTALTALPAALNVIGHVRPELRDITHEPLGVAVFAVGVLWMYEPAFSEIGAAGSVDDPNLTLGPDGQVRGFGGGASDVIPNLKEETLGASLEEMVPSLARVLQEGENTWVTAQATDSRGAAGPEPDPERHYQILETSLKDGNRLIVLADITDQVRRRRELRAAKRHEERARKEAERVAKLKTAMLANMSHEVRTPLTSIIGFAEILVEETGSGRAQRFASLIEESGERLLETLDGVLNLSKLEAGKMNIGTEPVDLTEKARTVARDMRSAAAEKGLELRVEDEGAPIWARADEGGVEIVLQNLLSNAIKYTDTGSVTVRTHREEHTQGGDGPMAVLEVEDTGQGMEADVVEELFEPFRQESEGLSRKYEGTGIGLAVTRRALDEMDGWVEVETEKGEGSCFAAYLPAASRERFDRKPDRKRVETVG